MNSDLSASLVPFDPLLELVELSARAVFYPLGFPLHVETNSEAVLAAAAESWDSFRPAFHTPPIGLRVVVEDGEAHVPPPAPVFRGLKHLFAIVSDASNFAVCDYRNRSAYCWLTTAAVADAGWARFHFLDALVYSSLAQLYLTPVHAACVALRNRGLLLCGESAAGKSSLAFACARSGWTYVSDDSSCLLWEGAEREVLGRPFHIRLRPSAAELFPELEQSLARRDGNGKLTIELRTADLPGVRTAPRARVEHVLFLKRGEWRRPRLVPVYAAEALRRLMSYLPLYDPAVREAQEAPLRRLAQAPAFELRYQRLESTVELLTQFVETGGE